MTSLLAKTRSAILNLLIVLLPFHAFLITWARSRVPEGNFVAIVSVWKEILMIIFLAVSGGELLVKRAKIHFDLADFLIAAFLGLSLVWAPLQRDMLGQWAAGFRLDVLPLLIFLFVRRLEWNNGQMKKWLIGAAGAVVVLGLLQALILPADFLTKFGYSLNKNEYTAGTAIASCQYLEHTQILCRAVSTFGGPTRFGTYLLVIIGVLIGSAAGKIIWSRAVLLLCAIVASVLTYSRSVWIGLVAMLGIGAYWMLPRKGKYIALGLGVGLVLIAVFALQLKSANLHDPLRSVLLRSNSTQEHLVYMKAGAASLIEHPWGTGMGTAGAASYSYEKFLTENWWLQIGVEMGWIGMILYAAIFGALFWMLYKKADWPSRGLALAVVGLAVTGMLTHSLEELATSVTFFALAGIQLSGATEKGVS